MNDENDWGAVKSDVIVVRCLLTMSLGCSQLEFFALLAPRCSDEKVESNALPNVRSKHLKKKPLVFKHGFEQVVVFR